MDFKQTFTSFSSNKISESKDFYTQMLDAKLVKQTEGFLHLSITDHDFMIYHKENHTPASYTILNFEVYDIESTVSDLSSKGIVFEQYNTEYIKTDSRGISEMDGTKMAWFKDPSGNVLGLIETS